MLNKEKIFINRGSSAKASRVKNLFFPNTSKAKTSYPSININTSLSETPPPLIFTMPNNRKLTSGMGNNIEREQLYENNMQLRQSLNKLERQLKKSKYMNVKTEMELRKKEKLINNYLKDSKVLSDNKSTNNNDTIISPIRDSALLTLFKQKYNAIKAKYEKVCADNKILKANIKLTNIREFQIENDVLNKEVKKIKALYENSKTYYEKYKEVTDKLKEMKSKFIEQHAIVLAYEQKIEILNQQIINLTNENNNIKKEIDNAKKKKEKLNLRTKILEIKNKKLLENKKLKESFEFQQNNYKKDYEAQQKEIFELKSALNVRISEIQTLQKECDTYKLLAGKKDNTAIEPINYENFKHIEKKSNSKDIDKIELYKSLYDESLAIISAYEKYFEDKNINPNDIRKKYGYKGILNSNNKVSYNLNNKIKEKSDTTNNNKNDIFEKDNNTDAGISNTNTKPFSNINQNINNNLNEIDMKEKENFYLSLFIKNLEGRKVTTEEMLNKINEINKSFENKDQISIEEFISPFANILIESMKISQKIDKEQIKKFLYEYLDYLQNDMKEFLQRLVNAFENIIDYESIPNKEILLDSLAFNLQKNKDEYIKKFAEIDINKTNLISFQNFMNILSELGDPIRVELLEFILYLMKKDTDETCSMFDFNYKIILELLERKIPDDFKDNELEDDEKSQLVSNKLSEFKYNMELENTNLEKVCADKIQKIEFKGVNYEVIDKKDFFDIMEKYKITLNEEIKGWIYQVFMVEEPEINKNEKKEFLDFAKLKNLFLNNYYAE